MTDTDDTTEKPARGFAAMTPEKRREISQRGGRAVQASGKAHKWTSDEARAAGSMGGRARRNKPAAEVSDA